MYIPYQRVILDNIMGALAHLLQPAKRRFIVVLCICLLSACNVSLRGNEQIKYLQPLPSMERTVKKRLHEHQVFSQGNWPDKQWWKAYHSPELNTLIDEALAKNPSIQEVRSRVQVARQESIIVGSVLFPLIYFDASDISMHSSKHGLFRALNPKFPLNTYLVDLSLSFNYEFDFWGQNHKLFFEAIGKAKAQEAEAADVELITTTALAQAFFAYKTNCVRRKLYQQLVQIRTNLTALNRLLLQKGLSSALTPYLAAEKENEAKKLLATINDEIAVDTHLINILAGRGPDSPLHIDKHLPMLPSHLTIPKTISIDLLARRPDLMAQIWRAKALAHKTGAAMADFYPNVNIIGLIGLESTSWKRLFETASGTTAVKPAINLPIFTAGAIRANINATKAQFDAAIFAYNNLLLRSTQEVLDVLAFAQSVYQQKREQGGIVNDAQKRYALTTLRQKMGLDNQFDTYYLQEEVIEKQLSDVVLLYNQYVASIKLTKSLGGGYCQTDIPLVKPSRIQQSEANLHCRSHQHCVPRGHAMRGPLSHA